MKKWLGILLILTILASFSLGCAEIKNERKIKCPKCGNLFRPDRGSGDNKMK